MNEDEKLFMKLVGYNYRLCTGMELESWKEESILKMYRFLKQHTLIVIGRYGPVIITPKEESEPQESENKDDSESTASRFKCKAEQGGWCKRWERECVSYENCELSSYNFPCPGCVASSPLEREECNSCKWKDEKQKHYQS